MKDILYEVKYFFLPFHAILEEVKDVEEDINVKSLENQYEQVKEAIPEQWLKKLRKIREMKGRKLRCL